MGRPKAPSSGTPLPAGSAEMLLPQEPSRICPSTPRAAPQQGAAAAWVWGQRAGAPLAYGGRQHIHILSAGIVSRAGEHSQREYTLELARPTCLNTPFLESVALPFICSNCDRRQTGLSRLFENISQREERQNCCICLAPRGGSLYLAPPHFSRVWLATSPRNSGNETSHLSLPQLGDPAVLE